MIKNTKKDVIRIRYKLSIINNLLYNNLASMKILGEIIKSQSDQCLYKAIKLSN